MSDTYEAVFPALAHPARRRILISLNFAGGEMTAGAIAGLFAHAWPTTTRHLQALETARLIRHERRGPRPPPPAGGRPPPPPPPRPPAAPPPRGAPAPPASPGWSAPASPSPATGWTGSAATPSPQRSLP